MKIIRLITIGLLLSGSLLYSQSRGFGAGIIVGEPTGVSLKYFMGQGNAIDAGIAWSFNKDGALHIHADYLYHDYNFFNVRTGKLPVYIGIGGRAKLASNTRVGVRIPVGMAYEFQNAPFDVFIEVVPLLDLAPDTEFGFNGAVGFRYYFE